MLIKIHLSLCCIALLGNMISSATAAGCPFSKRLREGFAKVSDDGTTLKEDADPETTTPNGCNCTSSCRATLDGDKYGYDWCYTADECGEYNTVYGYWDKCLYLDSSKPDYVAQTWQEKQEQMWANIVADDSMGPSQNQLNLIRGLLTESVKTTFENEWDNMPVGRVKVQHGTGAVCPFVVDIKDSPFTGLFQDGQTHGMIRLGSATTVDDKSSGVAPGGGVKFFRTGKSSANFLIRDGTPFGPIANNNYNFFSVPLYNQISVSPLFLIAGVIKLCQASDCPSKVGLSDICRYDQEGNEAENIVFPYKVTFAPTGAVNFREEPSTEAEFYKQFNEIAVGTAIYELRGHQNPDDEEGWLIGNVVTTDRCVTSLYGDTKMFFRHQNIAEDKALRPEWTEAYEADCRSYC